MKFNSLLALISFNMIFSTAVFSAPSDVVPVKIKKGDAFVKVTKTDNQSVRFEKCLWEMSTPCTQIGSQSDYLISALEDRRFTEQLQVAGAVVADAAVLVVTTYVGGAVGAIVSIGGGSFLGGSSGALVVGKVLGIAGGLGLAKYINPLNPVEQNKQAGTLSKEVLDDKEVAVKNVDSFIERLELVLAKM